MQTHESGWLRWSKGELVLRGKWGYLAVVAIVSLALVWRLAADRQWGDRMPYTTFFIAAILCISLTEAGPSVLSIIAGLLLANWFFVPPRHSLNLIDTDRFLMACTYLLTLGIVLAFGTSTKRALAREHARSEELRQRSGALKASEKRFQALAESAFEGILISQKGRIIDCNEQLAALVGYTREELLGKQALDFISSEQRAMVKKNIMEERVSDYELDLICKDGSTRAVESHGKPTRTPEGENLRVSVVRDATERKQRERALQRQAALIDLSPDATVVRETGGKILFWSSGAESLYGWTKAEAVGRQIDELLQTRFPGPLAELRQAFEEKGRWEGEVKHLTKDGKTVIVQSRWLIMKKEGTEHEILESNLDISDRKRSEETMRQRTEELERLMDTLPAAVWLAHDAQCQRITGNRCANELLDVKPGTNVMESGIDGFKVRFFTSEGRQYQMGELPLHRAVAQGVPVRSLEMEFRGGKGKRAWLLGSAEPLFDATGRCRGAVAAFLDETERKGVEEDLRRARDELSLANDLLERRVAERTQSLEAKTSELNAFCYSLAHDFRAPLRTQEGFARILVEEYGDKLGPEGSDLAWRVLRAAQRQSDIIQDLLAHISVTRSELPLESIELREALDQVRADLALELRDKKAEIRDEEVGDIRVMANASSLHLILLNLLTNGFKFSRPEVTPSVRMNAERRGQLVRLWVEDNGIGIAQEDIGKLFSMFKRLNANAFPGTGMGLAIVKKAAERMGGSVGVESEPGKGSRFWLDIPSA